MNKIKPKLVLYLVIIVSVIVYLILLVLSRKQPQNLLEYFRLIPKVISIDVVLYYIFQKWLWKWQIFKNWLVPFPNLNGTWKGNIYSNWIDPTTGNKPAPIPVILTIHQTFSGISCAMRTKEMVSLSYISDFIIEM